ncbi:MAG: gliding motility protein GldC [Flavobacteriaceae bacterium]|nr:gliding motility protein GldC [Flavobacteriaceae bacterium]
MMASHESKITINVSLDDNKIPEEMTWSAPDGGVNDQETKAVLLSVWDDKAQEALRIDLWTKTMPLDEMKVFFHQTLSAMADTYERATNDDKMSATMRDFCDYFAEKLALKPPKK